MRNRYAYVTYGRNCVLLLPEDEVEIRIMYGKHSSLDKYGFGDYSCSLLSSRKGLFLSDVEVYENNTLPLETKNSIRNVDTSFECLLKIVMHNPVDTKAIDCEIGRY